MLRTYALADLFSANLDSIIEGIFLCTTSGSLIALSPQLPPSLSKRLSILGALTWRFHWNSIRGSRSSRRVTSGTSTASSASSPGGLTMAVPPPQQPNGATGPSSASRSRLGIERAQPLPVLRAVVAQDGTGLQELTVQSEQRVCSLEYVKEGFLVGTVSRVLLGDVGRGRRSASGEEAGSDDDGDSDDGDGDESSTSGDKDDQGNGVQGNGTAENARREREMIELRERNVRLLALKASAMAEYLREELKDFKMPAGLE